MDTIFKDLFHYVFWLRFYFEKKTLYFRYSYWRLWIASRISGLLCFQRRESCVEKWRLQATQSGTPAIQFELSALKLRPGLGGDLTGTVTRPVGFTAPLFFAVCGLRKHRN